MSSIPPKPKKQPLIPMPLVLVIVFIAIIIIWGQLTSVSGERITFLHTNDLQGQLIPIVEGEVAKEEFGGFARIATIVDEVRSEEKNVIVLDSGDTVQGTLFTKVYGGIQIAELMTRIGYNAVTIGDHDFDSGPEGLREFVKNASFPFLVANIDLSESKYLTGLFSPSDIIDVEGKKIGIFGLTTEDANVSSKTDSDVRITSSKEAARKMVDELEDKCDMIVAISHLGLQADRKLANDVPGIDLIVGGGSKSKLTAPVILNTPKGKTIIVQAYKQGRYLGRLDIALKDKNVKIIDYKLIPVDYNVVSNVEMSTTIRNLYDKLKDEVNRPIGRTEIELDGRKSHIRTRETNLGNLFVEAIKEKFPQVDVVIQNAGGIRGDGIIPAGKITVKDVWEWHPFENKIVLVTIKGKELKEVLERGVSNLPRSKGNFLQVEGLAFKVDLTGSPQELSEDNNTIKFNGERVKEVLVNGKPLDYNKDYRVAINDFIYSGGDGFVSFKKAKNPVYTNVSLADVVIEYFQKNSPVKVGTDNKINIKGGLLR